MRLAVGLAGRAKGERCADGMQVRPSGVPRKSRAGLSSDTDTSPVATLQSSKPAYAVHTQEVQPPCRAVPKHTSPWTYLFEYCEVPATTA